MISKKEAKPLLSAYQKKSGNGLMGRRHGSGCPKTVSTGKNMDLIEELVCSQEEQPHTHLPPKKTAGQAGISPSSIRRIMKKKKETFISSST